MMRTAFALLALGAAFPTFAQTPPATTLNGRLLLTRPETQKEVREEIRAGLAAKGITDEKLVDDLTDRVMKKVSGGTRFFFGNPANPDGQKRMEDAMKRLQERLKDAPAWNFRTDPGQSFRLNVPEFTRTYPNGSTFLFNSPGTIQLDPDHLKKLRDSLTPDQRKKAQEQGYLTPEDLNRSQRDLLNSGKNRIRIRFETPKPASGSGIRV